MKKKKYDKGHKCYQCDKCIYIGEGGYICDMTADVVIDDWTPTENFYECVGKEFEPI